MDEMRNNEERMKKQVRELTTENKKYSADIKTYEESLANFTRQLANYEKDKQSLIVGIYHILFSYACYFFSIPLIISEYEKEISNN